MANAGSSFDSANDVSKSFVGSGFVIDPSGLIVTNYHVVEGAYEISVTLSDGTVLPGKLLHASRVADLAIVQVQVDHQLTPVQWGDMTKIRVGDQVFAIGNPLGIGISVSGGIVSGAQPRRRRIHPTTTTFKPTRQSIMATPAVRCSTWKAMSSV